jgi:GT2 family glycosyltransferase
MDTLDQTPVVAVEQALCDSPSDEAADPSEAIAILGSSALDPLFRAHVRAGLPSGWHAHVPFAHWVVHALRPRIIVELGTYYGVSYAAFCESVIQSRLDTRCHAVDTWAGDSQTGFYGEEVYQDFRSFHDSRYFGFSELLRGTFDDALPHFADGSIDLLHIDGFHTYEAVSHDFRQWKPKLSDRAVVLFHDINVRTGDFGVWRLWDELSQAYRNFAFLHGHGLGVLLVGDNVPKPLAELCDTTDPAAVNRLRARFGTLGQRYAQEAEASHTLVRLLTEVELEQRRLQAELQPTRALLDPQRSGVEAQQNAEQVRRRLRYEARGRRLWRAPPEGADQDSAHAQEIAVLTARLRAAKQVLAEQQAFIDGLLASASWRVTRPLREAVTSLRLLLKRLRLIGHALTPSGRQARLTISASFRRRLKGQLARETSISDYNRWIARFDELRPADRAAIAHHIAAGALPRLHVLTCFAAGQEALAEAWIDCLNRQLFGHWQAIFCFDRTCVPGAMERARARTAGDARFIHIQMPPDAQDRQALATPDQAAHIVLASGEAVLREHALYGFAVAAADNPESRLIYSDEDEIDAEGRRCEPWFKPDFSPELLNHTPYLGPCVLLRGQDHELSVLIDLLATQGGAAACVNTLVREMSRQAVAHVPSILYHARATTPQGTRGGAHALAQGSQAIVVTDTALPTVSIIIPTKDRLNVLATCLASIAKTAYPPEKIEIIVVDNNSTDAETLRFLAAAKTEGKIRLLHDRQPFNFARINNRAAGVATGEVLLFLNNDTAADRSDWLRRLVAYIMQPDVGVVGAKLLYPNRSVQHGGVVLGIEGAVGHAHLGLRENEGGYRDLGRFTREVSAVTGACLAIRRSVFQEVQGFDETLHVTFSDVLLCLDAVARGYRNIVVAEPTIIHHESGTRGPDDTPAKRALARDEFEYARIRHGAFFKNDPYYSPNLSIERIYELAWPPRTKKPWQNFARRTGAPPRVLMLSITHQVGHGVAVVLNRQAEELRRRRFEVFIGGPLARNEFAYEGCHRVYIDDPREAACFAFEHGIDCVVAHTPPFFSTMRWLGEWPRSVLYDYGEPNPDLFPDAELRRRVLVEKRFCCGLADRVLAISESVRSESGYAQTEVLPLGNSHLAVWGDEMPQRRARVREEFGFGNKIVVLNVFRFHRVERYYKGIDTYADVIEEIDLTYPDLRERVVFALAGKAEEEDVREMEALGLRVFPNPTDERLIDLYVAADVYMNFSHWEGYNLGIGQALALGLPVIASDIPPHREFPIVTSNDPVESAARFAAFADDLLTGKAAASRTPTVYPWDGPLARFASVISELLQR